MAERHGVVEKRIEIETSGGKEIIIYLERMAKGKKLLHTVPIVLDENEMLAPSMIRYICDSLKVPKADFGLTIG